MPESPRYLLVNKNDEKAAEKGSCQLLKLHHPSCESRVEAEVFFFYLAALVRFRGTRDISGDLAEMKLEQQQMGRFSVQGHTVFGNPFGVSHLQKHLMDIRKSTFGNHPLDQIRPPLT